MTVINAIKFDEHSGAIISDEERTLNMERKLCSIDKIKHIIPLRIQKEYGLVARMGTTGTCSVGSEIKYALLKELDDMYDKEIERFGKKPEQFKSLEDVAYLVFDKMVEIKQRHVDELLKTRYGFDRRDLIRGFYMSNDTRIDIKDKDIIKEAEEILTWKKRTTETDRIFINIGVVAGWDSKEGFQIYHLSLMENTCESVHSIFQSDGSGQDLSNVNFIDFIRNKTLTERRTKIDHLDGLINAIKATNHCHKMNIGIGGYLEIVYFNGQEKDNLKKMKQFDDNRSKLATEIVDAFTAGFLNKELTYELMGDLILNDEDFKTVYERMMKGTTNFKKLSRYLRGYKI
ncbi:MAG TPA: hypothetical protein PL110_17000 [Candidatus Eremiobacteraeota bacterium]|nr:MAG: hypothetical protein BWY64_03036 [bacterium ADurb.Bin363]HPZ09799.1 hypothetical protein [Candidatus Eremiobacteraeota bacterium]